MGRYGGTVGGGKDGADMTEPIDALIGKVLLDPKLIHNVLDLRPEHILEPLPRAVWGAMLSLAENGDTINRISIKAALPQRIDRARAQQYMTNCTTCTPTMADVNYYADLVLDDYERRRMVGVAEKLARVQANHELNVEDVKSAAVAELLQGGRVGDIMPSDKIYDDDIRKVTDWAMNPMQPGQVRGTSTSIESLDKIMDGLFPGSIIAGAAPHLGKTALALSIATHISKTHSVLYCTWEQPPDALQRRCAGGLAQISSYAIKRGLDKAQLARYHKAAKSLAARKLFYYDGDARLSMVTAAINRMKHMHDDLGLVVIDNLGHVRTGEETWRELGTVGKSFQRLSHRLEVPILSLHHIRRDTSRRNNKRPTMSDLRDSGYLEGDADIIWLLYRSDYYNNTRQEKPSPQVEFEIGVVKNRTDGALGVAYAMLDRRFGNVF